MSRLQVSILAKVSFKILIIYYKTKQYNTIQYNINSINGIDKFDNRVDTI